MQLICVARLDPGSRLQSHPRLCPWRTNDTDTNDNDSKTYNDGNNIDNDNYDNNDENIVMII